MGRADRRVHVVGKGVLRFHAVYWPAILLSAGQPLPTEIFVHDYLTVDGAQDQRVRRRRLDGRADPVGLAATYGVDALRWWLLRDVPQVGDTDFSVDKLIARANDDLRQRTREPRQPGGVAGPFLSERGSPACRPPGSSRWLAAAPTDANGWSAGASDAIAAGPDWPADAIALRAPIEADA